MFELSVARKYLLPRWRQLSVSIISLISVLVIALVVWLIVVFFSVTNGLEKYWINKMIALTAPVRVKPTDAYYHSYYYLVDAISHRSDYNVKSIGEKRMADETDPYDLAADEEVPADWSEPLRNADGTPKDLVKELFASLDTLRDVPGFNAEDYEHTPFVNLRMRLIRGEGTSETQSHLTQLAMLGSVDTQNPSLVSALLPITGLDVDNVLRMVTTAPNSSSEDTVEETEKLDLQEAQRRLKGILEAVQITALETPPGGWILPRRFYPKEAKWKGIAVEHQNRITQVIVPLRLDTVQPITQALTQAGYAAHPTDITIKEGHVYFGEQAPLPRSVPLVLPQQVPLPAEIVPESQAHAQRREDLRFRLSFVIQDIPVQGVVNYQQLRVSQFSGNQADHETPWVRSLEKEVILPPDSAGGEPLLLPRQFREAGLLIGDRGSIAYQTQTTSSVQEQRIPFFVAGFYDPGIIPLGGKFALADKSVTSLIRSSYNMQESDQGNGVNVRFDHLGAADEVKARLVTQLQQRGISPYWQVETFREFEFAKDILQQQRSDKNLFLVIAGVIIIVACSNIISMLIILVNDKKVEIGILRSMGASSASISAIFGICGCLMGLIGSAIGVLAAMYTLHHLDGLIAFMGYIQGHDMFNPIFYGSSLPNELSVEALIFVVASTTFFSLIAGIVPAVKASLLKPSAILRSE